MDDDSLEEFLLAAKTEWYLRRDFLANYQQNISQEAYVLGAFLVGVCVGLLIPRICQPFRRFMTVEEIPLNYFQQRRKIHGVAVSFSDGDTFRARHLPFWRGPGAIDGKMSKNTLQIRLAGIDTPETPKFGNKGQPYGKEAKEWLSKNLENKRLTLTLLHKDQYSRAVCMVHYGRWPFRKNASEELLKSGLAHVYRQAGAVYGGRQEVFEQLEAKAKAEVINIWSLGEAFETSGEYKARMRSTY